CAAEARGPGAWARSGLQRIAEWLSGRPGCRGAMMDFAELLRYEQPDIAEEGGRALSELVEEGEDLAAQVGEIARPGVQVQDVLLEPAPELLDGIEPGRVGRQG